MIDIEKSRAPADRTLAQGGDAGRARGVLEEDFVVAAIVVIEGVQLVFIVGDKQRESTAAVVVSGIHTHAPVRFALIVHGDATGQTDFLEFAVPAVSIEVVFNRVIGHVDIRFGVVV